MRGRSPAQLLERCGWSRSVGGVGPYLTMFSRDGMSCELADKAAASLEIHELPTARGCTYVVPSSDFALGLTVGRNFSGDMKTALKLGVTEKEVDTLCDGGRQGARAGRARSRQHVNWTPSPLASFPEMQSLIHDEDRDRPVMVDAASKPMGGLADLPSHAILDRGQIIGLWEFDPGAGSILWATFRRRKDKALVAAVEETESFVRDQLGDARSFSLDSPKSRAARLESLRVLAC